MSSPNFDYVIVGGGSAACVIADRLSASGKHSVCVIEAGPRDNDPRIKVPLGRTMISASCHPEPKN